MILKWVIFIFNGLLNISCENFSIYMYRMKIQRTIQGMSRSNQKTVIGVSALYVRFKLSSGDCPVFGKIMFRYLLVVAFLFGIQSVYAQDPGPAGIMWHEKNPRIDRRHGIGIGVDPFLVGAPAQGGISYHYFIRSKWELEGQLRILGLGVGLNYHYLGDRTGSWSPYLGVNLGMGGILDMAQVFYVPAGIEHISDKGIFVRLAAGPAVYMVDQFLKESVGPDFSFGGSFKLGYRFVNRSSRSK